MQYDKVYCTKCTINWLRLHTQDVEDGDETYEYCPMCKSDMFLTEGKDAPAYICCPITMKKIEVKTLKIQ